MKLVINDDEIIVFLNNKKYINCNEVEIESFFKTLFEELENKYNIDMSNYNNVSVYRDYNYGMILRFTNDDIEYFFDTIDIKINIFKENYFLYNINYNYINKDILKYCNLYKFKDKLYLKINNKINEKVFIKILEYSDIIYGEKVLEIEKLAKKVNYEKTSSSISR